MDATPGYLPEEMPKCQLKLNSINQMTAAGTAPGGIQDCRQIKTAAVWLRNRRRTHFVNPIQIRGRDDFVAEADTGPLLTAFQEMEAP